MGSGLAKQIKDKYPRVYSEYKEIMGAGTLKRRLGKCQIVKVSSTLYVANLFGQLNYGGGGIEHTDYTALAMALSSLSKWRNKVFKNKEDMPIYLPLNLGCGLAGGDWKIVRGIIEDTIPDAFIVRYFKEDKK
jgi:hypothetical protein